MDYLEWHIFITAVNSLYSSVISVNNVLVVTLTYFKRESFPNYISLTALLRASEKAWPVLPVSTGQCKECARCKPLWPPQDQCQPGYADRLCAIPLHHQQEPIFVLVRTSTLSYCSDAVQIQNAVCDMWYFILHNILAGLEELFPMTITFMSF